VIDRLVERRMLVPGLTGNPWETPSSLQPLQAANAGAPAAGIGIGQFVTDETAPAPARGGQPAAPPTGTIGQAALSSDVLGFLIWNQSQQPGAAPSATSGTNPAGAAGTNGANGAPTTGTGGVVTWPQLPSWFSSFSADAASATSSEANAGGSAALGWPRPSNANADPAVSRSQPDAAPESSGAHAHHHHHAGFAMQSQSGQSDPLANLLGGLAQGASSTSATNADGSTTTTITYADGSEVTLTTPPQASSTNPPPTAAAQPPVNSNNFLETLIQLQARLLSPSAAA
jgi:hypothetical protein